MTFIELSRKFTFVREAGQNHGKRVEAIQRWCGGQPGESWCCYFITMLLDIWFGGNSPIPRLGACEDVHQLAIQHGWMVTDPAPGDLFFYLTDTGHAHHIGLVTTTGPLMGLAGNTSADGASVDGDGVYEHQISAHAFARIPDLAA
jgi:hypothetical protein